MWLCSLQHDDSIGLRVNRIGVGACKRLTPLSCRSFMYLPCPHNNVSISTSRFFPTISRLVQSVRAPVSYIADGDLILMILRVGWYWRCTSIQTATLTHCLAPKRCFRTMIHSMHPSKNFEA